MIMKLEHTGLVVKDLDRQMAFYCDVVGLKVVRESEAIAPPGGSHTGLDGVRRKLVFLGDDSGEHQLELVYYIDPISPAGNPLDHHQVGSIHICFKTENIQDCYENLLHHGVLFLTPPRFTRGGAVCLCYAQDPEGNWIEFKEELKCIGEPEDDSR
jgi:catechol 2,3-dioxygenase-like lactoylglutathione lyase family enzyme